MEPAVVGDDPGCILAAVLDSNQAVVDFMNSRIRSDDPDKSTHPVRPPVTGKVEW
jgi:hypothetical protein